ncbi:MAG: GNAT family N-acetyltransferase [Bacteroidales bacterium]|nr:GNAT family N-acetyltransferase [Bacteroidales bacterium]
MDKQLVNKKEIRTLMKLPPFPGNMIAGFTMGVLKIDKLNDIYNNNYKTNPLEMVESLFASRGNSLEYIDHELERIPETGPFIIVCNHPFGGWDGISLLKTILPLRPDIKVLTNFMLKKIEPLAPYFIGVNPFETHKNAKSSFAGLREMHKHLSDGHPVAFFPSGEVATKYKGMDRVTDRAWQNNILKFIYNANVPVIPIFFKGENSSLFHLFGKIHPLLRTVKLPSEMVRFKNKTISIRIGSPVTPKIKEDFDNYKLFGSFIRAKTFALNTRLTYFSSLLPDIPSDNIIEPSPKQKLINEINEIHSKAFLFELENMICYCTSKNNIPNIFREISRLREITFRQVGEGTGKSSDFDKYDEYYKHLFIWDKTEQQIVGAYRVGFGKEIFAKYGKKGFYTNTLFNIKNKFNSILKASFELGRSFVVSQYQRKTNSLFMLWKGILILLMKNTDYRYLIGPVSISNLYAHNSKALLVEYFKRNYGDMNLKSLVKPKLEFTYTLNNEQKLLLDYCGSDIRKIDKLIEEIDPNGMKIPVLLKKYVAQGGKIICFNIDPDFNFAIDGFMISDIKEIPDTYLKILAKEIDDPALIKRFGD